MERKQNGGSFRSGAAKRLLSLILAFVMVLSLLPAIGLFDIQVSAASNQTVYFKDSTGWGTVYGYAWDSNQKTLLGSWPGTKLSKDSNGLYKMTVSVTGSLNFIFNNGKGGEGNQTADLSLTATQISAGNAYIVDGMGSPVVYTPPVIKDGKVTFTYVGSASKVLLAGTMNNWSGVAMSKSGNTFTYTYDLEPGMHEYKFVVDGNWISDPSNGNITGTDGNSYVVVSGSSSTATGNSVKIHFQNTLGWGAVCGAAWTIVGTSSNTIDGWSWPGQILQKDADGNYLLELSPNLVAGQSMGYLFHDFDKNQTVDLTIDYNTLSKGNVELWVKPTTANDEGKYNCSTATSFTASPKVEGNKVTFTYTGSATSVAVAGSFNSWSTSAAKMTKSGSTFTYTTTLADGIYEYKFVVNGSTWITDPSNGTVAGADGNSILFVGNTAANTAEDKITVQFHVTKTGGYTGWDAWVWNDFSDGTAYTLKTGTFSDKLVSVTVDGSASYVGFILRKSDWSSQDDTYYVDLKNITSGTVHCFVDYAKNTMTQISDKDVKTCGTLSYAKMDYESNIIWIKTTAPVDMSGVKFTDANGGIADVTVTGSSADGFGYNLTLSRRVTLDELSNLRVRLGGSECKIEPNDYLFYSSRFASEYTYNGDDLGATWTKTGTTFKVWAPTAWKMQVVRYKGGRWDSAWIETVDMTRGANGVWTVTVPGDLNGTYYNYVAHFAGYTTEAVDPYAKSTGPNSDRGMVLDMTSTNPAGWDKDISPNQGMTYTDAIIYEMHVREMTIESTSGVKAEWRGKFLGMTQEGTNYQGRATGLDHLKELGVTHVQLMPVYDFGWPDEYNLGGTDYSWGYNPRHFNVPEGSYSTNPEKGEVRVNEMKQMVQAFHSNGINVVMDVVYNHLDSAGDFCYNKLVPYYFTRFWDKNGDWGNVCNGSGVGNDFATQRSMARNYIVDSLSWWVEEYHVDGFRFDLAGLIDTQTINEAISVIQKKYPSVIFYGEGWDNYGTNMEGYDTTTQYNHWKVPSFAFFNNTLRDALGGNESKDNGEWGFAMGSSEKAETVMYSMRGMNSWASNPNQTINYISCHDGYSLTDKICVKRGGAYWSEIAAMNRLAGATVLLSQGIPMIYSGDEILREKLAPAGWRAHNSGHEAGQDLDLLNSIKWNELVTKEFAQVNDDYYAGLIEFRKNHSALRCSYIDGDGTPDAQKYTSAHRVSDQCILIYVDGYPNYECSDGIVIILNSGSGTQWVNFYNYGIPQGNWQACIHGDKAGVNALWSTNDGSVGVEGYSATVLVKGDLIDENSVYNRQSSNSGCRHTTHNQDGKCTSCGAIVSHSYVSGTCKICGKIQPGSDTSSTIYVDLIGKSWSKVNIYTWDADGNPITGSWPGSPMTKVEGNIYSYEVPGSATNIIFNDGTDQTKDMSIPGDHRNMYSFSTGTWGPYTAGGDQGGDTPAVGTTYYLVGYINGADYGCENDHANMGSYKFVNGKLETKFSSDSYVFLKTEGNGKWYLTEKYCTDTTANFIVGGTEKMFVPGGKDLVFTLTENADGSLTLSYAEATGECKHVYDEGVITKEASCGVTGEITYTCTLCGHSYIEPTMPWGHSYIEKVTTPASCTNPGAKTMTCELCGNSYTDVIPATGHSFVNGSCTSCGTTDPSTVPTTYYLTGHINGGNYGCEEDYENMGIYKFVDGKLTAKFSSDSYIFIKTEGNGKWLMATEFCQDTTCTFVEGGSEKMFVPGNAEITFTLTENADGSVTLSYTAGPVEPSVKPTLKLKAPTLEFKDMIKVVAFYEATNIQDVVEMGMITYSSKASTVSVETAEHVIPGAEYEAGSGRYFSGSQGIHAKYLGDAVYLAIYAKLKDGTYVYSSQASYSPVQYATSQLKGTDVKLKQLVAAMLNYGAEAQLYFGHNTSALANSSLTADQKALPEAYRSDMVSTVPAVPAAAQGMFASNSGFSSRRPAISFEGAFCINYFFAPKYAPDNGITLYYWTADAYHKTTVLTTANATGSLKMEGSGTGDYRGDITGISAKALSEAVYVAAIYESGGTTWTSGVLGYSIGAYCSGQASKGGDIAGLAMATAVYGYHAKQYFG